MDLEIKCFNKSAHNVYTLDKFNISQDIKCESNMKSFRNYINFCVYAIYCTIIKNNQKKDDYIKKIQPALNKIGCYCIPNNYIKVNKSNRKNKYLFGYFQSYSYFKKHESIIRKELQVNVPLKKENQAIIRNMKKENSVCIHIRRGDYVGSDYEVCTIDYYLNAIKKMNQLINKCKYYIFSDDMEWAKKNIKIKNCVYMDQKNSSYEDLSIMTNCKHFIISNSTFSWWAQFLATYENKMVIAPKKWHKKEKNPDLYMDGWVLID